MPLFQKRGINDLFLIVVLKNLFFIVNPICKRSHLFTKELAERIFPADSYTIEIHYTTHRGHATELAKQAIEKKVDIVVSVGGSGTAHEIIQPLAYSGIKFGIVPTGAGNPFAEHSSIPESVEKALQLIKKGHTRAIDIGRLNIDNNKVVLFMNYFCVGYSPGVANNVRDVPKRSFLHYNIIGIKELFRYKDTSVHIRFNQFDQDYEFYELFVGNISNYGKYMHIIPNGSVVDNTFDVMFARNLSFLRLLFYVLSPLFRYNDSVLDIADHHKANHITITFPKKMLIQTDFEVYEVEKETYVDILHHSLSVFVPSDLKFI